MQERVVTIISTPPMVPRLGVALPDFFNILRFVWHPVALDDRTIVSFFEELCNKVHGLIERVVGLNPQVKGSDLDAMGHGWTIDFDWDMKDLQANTKQVIDVEDLIEEMGCIPPLLVVSTRPIANFHSVQVERHSKRCTNIDVWKQWHWGNTTQRLKGTVDCKGNRQPNC